MTLGAPALQEPGEYQWLVTRRDIEDTPKYLDVADFGTGRARSGFVRRADFTTTGVGRRIPSDAASNSVDFLAVERWTTASLVLHCECGTVCRLGYSTAAHRAREARQCGVPVPAKDKITRVGYGCRDGLGRAHRWKGRQ